MERAAAVVQTKKSLPFTPTSGPVLQDAVGIEQAPPVKDVGAASFRILVVDDEPTYLELVLPFLKHHYPEVKTASNGRQAQDMIRRGKYDLVITDLYMPEVDGLELLQWIKRKHRDIDVILMTGELARDGEAEATRTQGAVDILIKPFSSDLLLAAVERCRNRRRKDGQAGELVSLLARPLVHGMADGLENAVAMLKMLQRGFGASMDETAVSGLNSVISDLFGLLGLTEEYNSLFLCLDRQGEIPSERFDLQADVIDGVLHDLRSEFGRRKISVVLKRNRNASYVPRTMQASRVLIRSVFRTLFCHAARCCRNGGKISYRLLTNGSGHQIRITYEGQPLNANVIVLAHQTAARAGNGTGYGNGCEGFGLSMADSVLRHYGGNLSCEPCGEGSSFIVSLPSS